MVNFLPGAGLRLALLILVLLYMLTPSVYARPNTYANPVVLLMVDNLTLSDITSGLAPQLESFFNRGACALLNSNVAAGSSLTSSYLTLGAGTRTKAAEKQPGYGSGEVFSSEGGSASEVLQRRLDISVHAEVLQPNIIPIVENNLNLGYLVEIGALGTALQNSGHKIAVIGCADTNTEERPLVNMFMNNEGSVAYGYLGPKLLVREANGPFGYWTSNEAVLATACRYKARADIIAIEWSDLYRADKYAHYCEPAMALKMREEALKRLDSFLTLFLTEFTPKANIIAVISPSPRLRGIDSGQRLTPMAIGGPNIEKGHLCSATTRRPGLVANVDIPVSILAAFNLLAPKSMIGHPLTTSPTDRTLEPLFILEQRAYTSSDQRPLLLRFFIAYLIFTLGLAILAALLRRDRLKNIVQYLLLSGVSVPLAFLLLPLLPPLSNLLTILLVIAAALLPPMAAFWLNNKHKIFWLIVVATVSGIVIDVSRGQQLVGSSILGYCFIGGSRYYGLGNEYMGIFVGATLTLLGLCLECLRLGFPFTRLLIVTVAGLGSYFIGSSQLGANAGGTLAFAVGSAAIFFSLDKGRIGGRELMAAITMAVIVLALLPITELYLVGASSHIGRAFQQVQREKLTAVTGIVKRKLSMNIKLLRYSLWSRVLLMLFLTLGIVFWGPYQHKLQLQHQQPALAACLRGSVVAALTALIANDSGVVAGATALLFPTTLLLMEILSIMDPGGVKTRNC